MKETETMEVEWGGLGDVGVDEAAWVQLLSLGIAITLNAPDDVRDQVGNVIGTHPSASHLMSKGHTSFTLELKEG